MSDDEWQEQDDGDAGWGDAEFEEQDEEENQEDAIRIQIENLFYEAEGESPTARHVDFTFF
jgi:hypothetical protein